MTRERLKSTISYTTTKESNMIKPFILCVADRYKDIRHIKTDYHYDSQTIISPLYNKELCQKYPSLYFYLRNIEPIYENEKLKPPRPIRMNFYGPLHKRDAYLEFTVMTGSIKSAHISNFSKPNTPVNVSMFITYSIICGVRKIELTTQRNRHIAEL